MFLIVIHWKLNAGCTTHVGNLTIICQLAILGDPRLLHSQICSILTIKIVSLKVRRSTSLENSHCHTRPKNYGSGTRPLYSRFYWNVLSWELVHPVPIFYIDWSFCNVPSSTSIYRGKERKTMWRGTSPWNSGSFSSLTFVHACLGVCLFIHPVTWCYFL